MYLAFNIRFVSRVMRDFGVAILTGWVAVQIVWTIVFELKRCCPPKTSEYPELESATPILPLHSLGHAYTRAGTHMS